MDVPFSGEDCAQLALEMCSSNGGIFVKMGQHAATLAPAVPAEYVERLAQLQDRAPESTWAEVLEVLNTELPGGAIWRRWRWWRVAGGAKNS